MLFFITVESRREQNVRHIKFHLKMPRKGMNVLLYVPNIIGYVRLGLLVAAWLSFETPVKFLCFYTISVILDGIDGPAARNLNQVSAFGAWLDVVVDNLGRGMLWTYLYKWGYFISALEWLVFVCTHSYGASWKSAASSPPCWVQTAMANGFKNPSGVFVISGLHGLPIILFATRYGVLDGWLSSYMQVVLTGILVSGRVSCLFVESVVLAGTLGVFLLVWFVWAHILDMIASESLNSKISPVVAERGSLDCDEK